MSTPQESTIYHRLISLIKMENLSVYAFERQIKISNGWLQTHKKEPSVNRKLSNGGIGSDILQRIYEHYPHWNMMFLVFNEGEMVNKGVRIVTAQDDRPGDRPTFLNELSPNLQPAAKECLEMVELLRNQVQVLQAANADKQRIIELLDKK